VKSLPQNYIWAYKNLLLNLPLQPPSGYFGLPKLTFSNGKGNWMCTIRGADGEFKEYFIGENSVQTLRQVHHWGRGPKCWAEIEIKIQNYLKTLRDKSSCQLDPDFLNILLTFSAAGVFRLGGVLVGTLAFRMYEFELGIKFLPENMATTNDIDIAVFQNFSLRTQESVIPSLPEMLTGFGFVPIVAPMSRKAVRWKNYSNGLHIDFISPSFKAGEVPQKIHCFGLYAQGLHHLNFLIRNPILAVFLESPRSLVRIPSPERYCVHKLICSTQRRMQNPEKSLKDRKQAYTLLKALNVNRTESFVDVYNEALNEGAAWRKAIYETLQIDSSISSLISEMIN